MVVLHPEAFTPLGERIVLRLEEPDSMVGSLIIPDAHRQPKPFARVVSQGPGMLMKNGARWPGLGIKPGDRVVFDVRTLEYCPRFKDGEGNEYAVVFPERVHAVVEEESTP